MSTDGGAFEVKSWQTYLPCAHYNWQPSKPFVVQRVVDERAEVWDPTGGQRMGGHRWVALRNLHPTSRTRTGKERRTGWYLHCEPPADPIRQELCGSCFTWKDREQFSVLAHGFGFSTCAPCKQDIEQRYGCL